jgi:hypothetical protein
MVRFRIGKELDRGVCRAPESALGAVTTGCLGLLGWLESQLGLEAPAVSFTARMVPYLGCLRERDSADAFFHRSLQRDEFGVAARLLQWRDTWFEAGWDGDGFDVDASRRLRELGTVEDSATDRVPPGPGQRVQRVLRALENTGLDVAIELLDPPDVFPKAWRRLFERLGASHAIHVPEPRCDGESDLARLQRALVADGKLDDKLQLTGDGTVIVLRDGSPQLSAPWVARFVHRQLEGTGEVAVLVGDHGATLDDALADAGHPRLGFSDASFWRPAFQVLPLALELIWEPLDPGILLQFLTHPMGPIPRHVREPLARIVAKQPGIGGDGWTKAVDDALAAAVRDLDADAAADRRKEEAEKIEFWLMNERVDPRAGAGIELLRQRVRRVSDWLGAAANAQEDETRAAVYRAALGQSDDLLRTLDRLGQSGTTNLNRESLRRLVEAVRGTGTSRPGRPRQCAAGEPQLMRADTPAAFLAAVDTVVWWGCDDERMPGAYPWSTSEIAALGHCGVELVPVNTQLEWQAQSWLRPVLAARKRLALVLHDNAETHHPIFDQVLAIATGWTEERVDRLMRDPALLPLPEALPATRPIAARDIPRKQRWWQLPANVQLPARDSESFTSLEKFLYGPHQWVLDYQARIRPGALAELTEGATLKGLLAHKLFENFFDRHADIAAIDGEVAARWARARMRTLIAEKGAVLLAPGRQGEREYFIEMAVRWPCVPSAL